MDARLLTTAICRKIEQQLTLSSVQLTSSGTDAFYALLSELSFEKGDILLLPSFLCERVILPVVAHDISFKFVDVEAGYVEPCLDSYKKAYSSKVKALLLPYLFGYVPRDLEAILAWARQNSIIVIEDVASSYGLSYKGKMLGSWGDYCFGSFGYDKLISVDKLGFYTGRFPDPNFSISEKNETPLIEYNTLIKKLRLLETSSLHSDVLKLFSAYYDEFVREKVFAEELELLNIALDHLDESLELRTRSTEQILSTVHSSRVTVLAPNNDQGIASRVAALVGRDSSDLYRRFIDNKCWVGRDYHYPIHKWFPGEFSLPNTACVASEIISLITNPKNESSSKTLEILTVYE